MLVFSNTETRDIIKKIVADESYIEHRSESTLLEVHILNDLLPKERSAAMWIRLLYSNDWDIQRVLNACFGYLAAGINWKAKYSNARKVVEYAKYWNTIANSALDPNATEIYHFLSQFDSMVYKIESLIEAAEDKYRAKKDADWIKELYRIAKEEPENLNLCQVYQFILEHWNSLGDWSITYRMLSDMAMLQNNWHNTAEARYELLQVLREVSAEWN